MFEGRQARELKGHRSTVRCVGWNLDGRRFASGSSDHTIRIWTFSESSGTASFSHELKGHGASVDGLCWNPASSEILASISSDKTIRIWNARHSSIIHKISVPASSGPISLAWSVTGNLLAVGSKDDTIRIIDCSTGEIAQSHRYSDEINQIAFNPDGKLVLLTSEGSIMVCRVENLGNPESVIAAHAGPCYAISWPAGFSRFAIGGGDAVASVWDSHIMASCSTMGRLDWPIRALALSNSGEHLAATGSEDGYIDISDASTGEHLFKIPVNGPVTSLAWHPKRDMVLWAAEEVDPRSGRPFGNLRLL